MLLPISTRADEPAPPRPVEYFTDGQDVMEFEAYLDRYRNRNDVDSRYVLERVKNERVEVRGKGERTDRWITKPSFPTLTLYMPAGKPTASVLICPGGGYYGLSFDKEGTWVAKWFRDRGVAAAVLKYSLSDKSPIRFPDYDVHYAVRVLKEKVGGKVGLMGFSAGGHLAAMAASSPIQEEIADGTTDLMSYNSTVDFLALIYPVVTMEAGIAHGGSRSRVLGDTPTQKDIKKYSAEAHVSKNVPPTFLVHASDDEAVPAENSIRFYQACLRAGVPAELHLYEKGGHGYGMWRDDGTIAEWPRAFERWLIAQGVIKPGKAE